MKEQLAVELLQTHLDGLLKESDLTALLSERYPDLQKLLQIAQQLSQSYEQVPISAEMYHTMAPHTWSNHQLTPAPRPHHTAGWVIGTAVGIGSAVTGLALYLALRLNQQRTPRLVS